MLEGHAGSLGMLSGRAIIYPGTRLHLAPAPAPKPHSGFVFSCLLTFDGIFLSHAALVPPVTRSVVYGLSETIQSCEHGPRGASLRLVGCPDVVDHQVLPSLQERMAGSLLVAVLTQAHPAWKTHRRHPTARSLSRDLVHDLSPTAEASRPDCYTVYEYWTTRAVRGSLPCLGRSLDKYIPDKATVHLINLVRVCDGATGKAGSAV